MEIQKYNPIGDRAGIPGIRPTALGEMSDDDGRARVSQGLQNHVDLAEKHCAYFTQVTLRLLYRRPVTSYMWYFLVPYSDEKGGGH